jgi:hypothetical protein
LTAKIGKCACEIERIDWLTAFDMPAKKEVPIIFIEKWLQKKKIDYFCASILIEIPP